MQLYGIMIEVVMLIEKVQMLSLSNTRSVGRGVSIPKTEYTKFSSHQKSSKSGTKVALIKYLILHLILHLLIFSPNFAFTKIKAF